MSPALPLFIPTGDKIAGAECYVPNTTCHDVEKYRFVGNLMGACIRSEERLTVDFPACIWELLAGRALKWESYAELEPELAESLRQIAADDFPAGRIGDAAWNEVMCLTFTVSDGHGSEVELVKGGACKEVGYAERQEYVRLVQQYKLHQWDIQVPETTT